MNSKKEKLLNYLKSISGIKTISGLYISYSDSNIGVQTVQRLTGVLPGILTIQIPSISDCVSKWQTFVDKVDSHWNNGHLIHIVWSDGQHPLINMEDFKRTGNNISDERKWNDLITDGCYLNQKWKKQLDVLALFLLQLDKAGVILICDFLPYINERDYLFRGIPGINGSTKLFILTRDYLTIQHGLQSLIWTWSLDIDGDMEEMQKYWPPNNYVDVAAVYMWKSKEMETAVYQKLLDIVGDKPISMEFMYSVPSPQLLDVQSRWTWFTALDELLLNEEDINNEEHVQTTFLCSSVINKANIDCFK